MRVRWMELLLTVVIVSIVGTTHAATYQYGFDQANYTASPGKTVDVLVYLQETGGSVFRDNGLIGAGVAVCFDDLPQPTSPAKVLTLENIANVSDFEQEWSKHAVPASGYADISLWTMDFVYGTEATTGSNVYRLLLGRFTFTAGSVSGEVTHIRATDFDTTSDDVVYYYNHDMSTPIALDGVIQDARATITTVPEPCAIMLLAPGVAGILAYARRRQTSGDAGRVAAKRMG